MSRINAEECWWSDPRRTKLAFAVGSQALADGMALNAWRLAQEFWKRDRQLVPKSLFEALEGAEALLKVNLAEIREELVYIRGSSVYLDWLNESKESGRIGGKISAQRPRDEKGRLLPKETQVSSKGGLDKSPTGSKGLQTSSSSSSSLKDLKQEQNKHEQLRCSSVKPSFDLEKLYEGYPRKRGKTPGLKALSKAILTQKAFEELAMAIENYRKDSVGKEPKHVMYFSTFASQWRDWINVEADYDACSVNTIPINLKDLT